MAQAQARSRLLVLPDDLWSPHEVAEGTIPDNGYDNMHAASIPIG